MILNDRGCYFRFVAILELSFNSDDYVYIFWFLHCWDYLAQNGLSRLYAFSESHIKITCFWNGYFSMIKVYFSNIFCFKWSLNHRTTFTHLQVASIKRYPFLDIILAKKISKTGSLKWYPTWDIFKLPKFIVAKFEIFKPVRLIH